MKFISRLPSFNRIKLTTKLNACFLTIVVMVFGMVGFSNYNVAVLKGLLSGNADTQGGLGPEAIKIMDDISFVMLVSGIAVCVVATVLAYVMGRFLARNLEMIMAQMTRLSDGDLDFSVAGADRGDEIGGMAKTLQVFRENGLEMRRLEEQQKAAEQRQEEERRKAILQMADDFDTKVGSIVDGVAASAQEMQNMAGELSRAIDEATAQSNAVATASEEASVNVQTVSAAAQEMSNSIANISRNVQDTSEAARSCTQAAELSQNNLGELQAAIDEIDSVIAGINDVAEQTNLLALNATIEAARAGESGKGFAVVASEVKSLAGQTHQMTDDIKLKVSSVKDSAHATIEAINDIIAKIQAVDEKTAIVAEAVQQQNSATGEISRNVQEAANGTKAVSTNVQGIQRAANDSASSTEQLRGSSDSLAGEARDLQNSVDEFLREVRAS